MGSQVIAVDFSKAKSAERLNVVDSVNRSRSTNDEIRGRRHLQPTEIKLITKAIRDGSRYQDRDECMVLVAFHHGYRVSELVNLRWQHIDLKTGQIAIKRLKNGIDTVHPISEKRELMLLKRLHREQGNPVHGFVFRTERGTAVSRNGVQKMFAKFSEQALGIKWNIHALRHACGTTLIEKGHDLRVAQVYLGHREISNTVRYTHESAKQFAKIEW